MTVQGRTAAIGSLINANTGQLAASAGAHAAPAVPTSASAATGTSFDRSNQSGWNAGWEQTFTQLGLSSTDLQFMRTSGFTTAELASIADGMRSDLASSAAPTTGTTTPGATSATLPGAPNPVAGTGAARPVGAWSPQWAAKFHQALRALGATESQSQQALTALAGQPMTDASLQQVYDSLAASTGAWNDQWRARYDSALRQVKVPAAQRAQLLQQLSSQGLSSAQLSQGLAKLRDQMPAWNADWEAKFGSLGLPSSMVTQLKGAHLSKAALDQNFQRMYDALTEAQRNGRLAKLDHAHASAEERWGVMLAKPNDHDFGKAIDGIHSKHVPTWQRVASIAVNFIPGVGTLQYLSGKDWITGDKIDRSNPLNIGMAVLSAIPAVTWGARAVKTGMALKAMSDVAKAGGGLSAAAHATSGAAELGQATLMAGGDAASVVNGVSEATKAAAGAGVVVGAGGQVAESMQMLDRIVAAGAQAGTVQHSAKIASVVERAGQGFSKLDYLKATLPGISRVGDGAALREAAFSFRTGNQLLEHAAKMASTLSGADRSSLEALVNVPKSAMVEGTLIPKGGIARNAAWLQKTYGVTPKQLKAVLASDNLSTALKPFGGDVGKALLTRSGELTTHLGMAPHEYANTVRMASAGARGEGVVFRNTARVWKLNPFKATARVTKAGEGSGISARLARVLGRTGAVDDATVFNVGRGIRPGTDAGFAHFAASANDIRLADAASAMRLRASGLARVGQLTRDALLPGQRSVIASDAFAAAHAGGGAANFGLRVGSRLGTGVRGFYGQMGALTGAGLVSGYMRPQTQAMWESWKQRDQLRAQQRAAQLQQDSEQARMEDARRYYEQSRRNQTTASGSTAAGATAPSAASATTAAAIGDQQRAADQAAAANQYADQQAALAQQQAYLTQYGQAAANGLVPAGTTQPGYDPVAASQAEQFAMQYYQPIGSTSAVTDPAATYGVDPATGQPYTAASTTPDPTLAAGTTAQP